MKRITVIGITINSLGIESLPSKNIRGTFEEVIIQFGAQNAF